MAPDQMISFVNENNLDPVTLNKSRKENESSYDLSEAETIDEPIESSTYHHERFLSQIHENANSQVASLRRDGKTNNLIREKMTCQSSANEMSSILDNHSFILWGSRLSYS